MSKYFYTDGKDKYGPFSKEELKKQNLSRKTKIWCYGMDRWIELFNIPELSDVLNSIPPEINSNFFNKQSKDIDVAELKQTDGQEIKIEPPKRSENTSSVSKWLIAIIVIIIVSLFSYSLIQNQSAVNMHNEIEANSYYGNEVFDVYVQKFYRDLESYGIYPKKPKVTIIKFSKLDQIDNTTHIHGLSYGGNDDDKIEIYINPSTWNRFNKPMRYFLMYHELAHDVLNLDDLEDNPWNEGKLMYPEISSYGNINMDDFIESFKALFEEQSSK